MPRWNASQNLVSKERISVVEHRRWLHWTLKLDRKQLNDGMHKADKNDSIEEQSGDRKLAHREE